MAGRIAYLGNIATQGLVLDLDAAIQGSYPKTGTLWTDISGNNNNGTLVNGPAYTGSDYGAIVFDNTDDYVVISSSPTLAPRTGDFSNDFWINPTAWANSNWQPIQVTALTNGLWIGQNNTNQFVVRAYGVADRLQYSTRPTTGSWTNVSITRNSGLINLYYNGTPVAVSSSNQDFLQGTTYLGSDGVSGGSTVYFNGRIATDKYYNVGLSQFQVWQNFNAYKSRYGIPDIVTDGLVLNLDAGNPYSYLSGSSGTTWSNTVAVSSSISGTLVNGPVYSNGAITFDGVDDYVSGSDVGNLSEFTVDCWFYPTSNPGNSAAIITNTYTSVLNFVIGWGNTEVSADTFFGGFYNSGWVKTSGIPSVLNKWWNLTLTFSNGELKFYNSGSLYSTTSTIKIPTSSGAGYRIGRRWDTADYFVGRIPNVKIYNRALTQTEITQNFNALRGRYGI